MKPFGVENRKPLWVVEIKKWCKGSNQRVVLLGCKAPIETMFYTDAIAYVVIPKAESITRLQQLGYKILINELANPSKEIRTLKGIVLVSLNQ